MNIFVIPSWYPSEKSPLNGIFIKEQVEALSENFPQHNFFISNVEEFFFSISEIKKSLKTLKKFFKAKAEVRKVRENLTEFYTPILTWTDKFHGETLRIVAAHSENFLKAERYSGNIGSFQPSLKGREIVIHAHVSYPAGFAAMKMKEKFNIPYVITEHMGPFPFDRFIKNGELSYKIRDPLSNSDRIIAVSNFMAESIRSFNIKSPIVIPNMVNTNIFTSLSEPSRRPVQSSSKDRIKFLTVCPLIGSKGVIELMEAVKKSFSDKMRNEFTIIGKGELESYIRNFISANNLSDRVKLINTASRGEIVNHFQSCDVFILPSRMESFGIVYIEAMACGKPVIATDCGGPADFVREFNGRLIPVNDPEKIYEAIRFFSENLSTFSSVKIRDFVVKNYSQEVICKKIVEVYDEVME